jgi:hypothetical protein
MEGSHESSACAMALLMGGGGSGGIPGSSTDAMRGSGSALQGGFLPAGCPAAGSQPMPHVFLPGQVPGGSAAALGLQMQQLATTAHMSAQEQRVRGALLLLSPTGQPGHVLKALPFPDAHTHRRRWRAWPPRAWVRTRQPFPS